MMGGLKLSTWTERDSLQKPGQLYPKIDQADPKRPRVHRTLFPER